MYKRLSLGFLIAEPDEILTEAIEVPPIESNVTVYCFVFFFPLQAVKTETDATVIKQTNAAWIFFIICGSFFLH